MKDMMLEGFGKAPRSSFMGGYLEKSIINLKVPRITKSPTERVLDKLKWHGDEVNILVHHENSYSILVVENRRLEASVISEFKFQMQKIIEQGSQQIILDIGKLNFMDSSGLGALVSVMKTLSEQGKVVIIGASGIVYDLFKVTRMNQIFTLCDSLEEARRQFIKAA